MKSTQRACVVLLILVMLTACGPQLLPPAPTPTEEPVQARLPTSAPTSTALPTSTPVPLALNTTPISAPTAAPAPSADATGVPQSVPVSVSSTPPLAQPRPDCLAGQGGTVRLPHLRAGVVIALDANLNRTLDLARDLNVGWVQATVRWSDLEMQPGAYQWQTVDALTQGASARGLKVLLTVTQSPAWATTSGRGGLPDQPQTLGAFVGALAQHAKGGIAAYEIWRSPNTAAGNGGTVAVPGVYVDTLQAAYNAIKQADPCALVLNGALAPTAERDPSAAIDDLTFYRGMLAYNNGAFTRAHDLLAVQLNTSGKPKEGKWSRRQPAESRGYFSHANVIRDEMLAADEAEKQIWAVGAGYALTGDQAVSPKQQDEYLDGLFALSQARYPWLTALFVRELVPSDGRDDFGIVASDGAPRPAYERLRELFDDMRDERQRSREVAGTDVALVWEHDLGRIVTPLTVGLNGTVYGGTDNGYVQTIDANGALRGRIRFARKGLLGVAVDGQQTIYTAAEDGTLEAQSGGGTVLWNILTNSKLVTPLALSPSGDALYVGTRGKYLDAYNATDGAKRWGTGFDGIPGAPAVGTDGTVYVGTSEGTLYAIAPDGSERWQYTVGSTVRVAPVISSDAVYAVSEGGIAVALNTNGSPRWRTNLGAPAVGAALGKLGEDEMLFITTADDKLIAHSLDGIIWTTALQSGGPTAPAFSGDGRIIVGGTDGGVRVLSSQGQIEGVFDFDEAIRLAPVTGRDGAVYVKTDDGDLVAFGPKELRERYRLP